LISWPHSGFNVHSLVRTKTKIEAERVGKYMIRPLLALERLSLLESAGKIGYRHGENGAKQETMDSPEIERLPLPQAAFPECFWTAEPSRVVLLTSLTSPEAAFMLVRGGGMGNRFEPRSASGPRRKANSYPS